MCSKVRATTNKFGIVMERACFPRFPATCKKFGSLDNQDLPNAIFDGVQGAEAGSIIVFEGVTACFCDDQDLCNSQSGNEMNDIQRMYCS